jgi:MFS family permease
VRSPIRNVLLTEATDPATRGKSFGFERAMDSAGAVVGPLLALLFVGLVGLRWTFVLTLIPGLGAAALFLFLVKEKPHEPQPHVKLVGGLRDLPGKFKLFMGGVGVAGLSDFSNTLLILWATLAWTPIYGAARAVEMAMAFYVGYNVVYTIVCYVGGALSDRFPKHAVLAVGYALGAIPAIFLLLPGASIWKFAAVFGFSGLYTGIWETVENATAASVLPASMRGIGFGALATVNGISDFLSSTIVGVLWVVSPAVAMGFVIVTALGGSFIVAAVRPRARLEG